MDIFVMEVMQHEKCEQNNTKEYVKTKKTHETKKKNPHQKKKKNIVKIT